jgi:hypothetical protein
MLVPESGWLLACPPAAGHAMRSTGRSLGGDVSPKRPGHLPSLAPFQVGAMSGG